MTNARHLATTSGNPQGLDLHVHVGARLSVGRFLRDGPGLGAPRDPGELVAPGELGCTVPSGTLFCPLLLVTVRGILALRSREAPGRGCRVRAGARSESGATGCVGSGRGREACRQVSPRVLGKHPPGSRRGLRLGGGGALGLSLPGLHTALRCCPGPASEPQDSSRPPSRLAAHLSGAPALPGGPPGHGDGGRPALIVSMGDDFQGEISSSVESLSFRQRTKCHPRPAPPAVCCSPVAFKFTPLFLPDTCLNQYLPLQVVGRMCPALHTALLKSTKINTIIEIFSS